MSMRYAGAELQDRLAAEFVLGNLRGAARRRLVTLMRHDPALRERVERWEERLFPLLLRGPRVKAPQRVWNAVHARIAPRAAAKQGWRRFLVGGAVAATLAACLLAVVVLPQREPSYTLTALLNDPRNEPGIVVSWSPRDAERLMLRIVAHPQMPPNTSWQAWLVPRGGAAPLPLGLVGTDEAQVLRLSPAAARALPDALAIGVSVEAKGGSASGRPQRPFVFEGPAQRVGS